MTTTLTARVARRLRRGAETPEQERQERRAAGDGSGIRAGREPAAMVLDGLFSAAVTRAEFDALAAAAGRAGLVWSCPDCPGWITPAYRSRCGRCGRDAADTCWPADPDPTPAALADESLRCRAQSETGDLCTRHVGHLPAQHVAGDGHRVITTWPAT
jgi:hypothetical protein